MDGRRSNRAVRWERAPDSEGDADIGHILKEIFKRYATQSQRLRQPPDLRHFRSLRNSVVHAGAEPSPSDTGRYLKVARDFIRDLARSTWDVDLDRLTTATVISNGRLRHLLQTADALLTDPAHIPILEDGEPFPMGTYLNTEDGRRRLAVGVADLAWRWCWRAVSFKWEDRRDDLLDDAEIMHPVDGALKQVLMSIRDRAAHARGELRCDLLAMALGVPLPDLRRFETIKGVPIDRWSGHVSITINGSAPSPDDARFAVDFVIDWVLRSEQHFDLAVLKP